MFLQSNGAIVVVADLLATGEKFDYHYPKYLLDRDVSVL